MLPAVSAVGQGRATATAMVVAAGIALAACGEETVNENPFTSEGFGNAVEAIAEDAGEDTSLVQVQIKQGRALFKAREGDSVRVLVFPGDVFEPVGPEAVGETPGGEEFPLSDVDPEAVDRILEAVGEQSEVRGIEVSVMTLQRRADEELGWVIRAEGGGQRLVLDADADGSDVRLR